VQRVAIIGPGGAGKSMFARELGERTALPVIHLDRLFWKPGWVPMDPEEWHVLHGELLQADHWIIDGNYGGEMEPRLAAADTVVFLDMPRLVCLWGALQRHWRHRAGGRPDMVPGQRERIDLKFLWWIVRYPDTRRPGVLARLAKVPATTQVFRIRSRRAAREMLDRLAPAEGPG
jgi:adenylate kinase family enzyme